MNDEIFMQKALEQAEQAFNRNEVPIGAVVVNAQNVVVGVGYNLVETLHSQLEHAELRALKLATNKSGDWRLDRCTLYVTLEPCSMCLAAIKLSRIERVVFGADSPLFGYRTEQDRFIGAPIGNGLIIVSGVKKEQCAALLTKFFQERRSEVKK